MRFLLRSAAVVCSYPFCAPLPSRLLLHSGVLGLQQVWHPRVRSYVRSIVSASNFMTDTELTSSMHGLAICQLLCSSTVSMHYCVKDGLMYQRHDQTCLRRYDVLIDGESKKSGSIFDDFEPPFNPPAEIDDPDDKKPEDWVDSPKCVAVTLVVTCGAPPDGGTLRIKLGVQSLGVHPLGIISPTARGIDLGSGDEGRKVLCGVPDSAQRVSGLTLSEPHLQDGGSGGGEAGRLGRGRADGD